MAKADYNSAASYIRSVVEDSSSPKEKAKMIRAALGPHADGTLQEFSDIIETPVDDEPASQPQNP